MKATLSRFVLPLALLSVLALPVLTWLAGCDSDRQPTRSDLAALRVEVCMDEGKLSSGSCRVELVRAEAYELLPPDHDAVLRAEDSTRVGAGDARFRLVLMVPQANLYRVRLSMYGTARDSEEVSEYGLLWSGEDMVDDVYAGQSREVRITLETTTARSLDMQVEHEGWRLSWNEVADALGYRLKEIPPRQADERETFTAVTDTLIPFPWALTSGDVEVISFRVRAVFPNDVLGAYSPAVSTDFRGPEGACCFADGACLMLTRVGCMERAGEWLGMDSVCDPNPCPQPFGACCYEDGTCQYVVAAECPTGDWRIGQTCEPDNPCAQPDPFGACCFSDGTCDLLTMAVCSGEGGIWLGTDAACDPNPCDNLIGEMIWIPAGYVRLGQEGIAEPVHDVWVDGFWIGKNEVTNGEYATFIAAGGYTTEAYWNPVGWAWRAEHDITLPGGWDSNQYHGGGIPGNEGFPVNGVSWWEADAYCRWAGKRLPTEAEWEKAAKGGCEKWGDPALCDDADTPSFPWGEEISGARANYWNSGDPYDNNTTPIGFYDGRSYQGFQTIDSPSPYGLYDVAGNVIEWTSTGYESYPYNANDGREDPPATFLGHRVLRGGPWSTFPIYLGCAYRYYDRSYYRFGYHGFRCASD